MATDSLKDKVESLTPPQIVEELDRYIIAQDQAKKAVAIALRNRWRRMQIDGDMQDEITPKNIIMIGPTGVGKTEISRRLAKLVNAPFVKVEATKFTEVGYVGRDVDSIVRDLVEVAYTIVKDEERVKVRDRAEKEAEERLLDLLLPGSRSESQASFGFGTDFVAGDTGVEPVDSSTSSSASREKLRDLLKAGKLEQRVVEVELTKQVATQMQVLGPQGLGEIEGQIKDMFSQMVPKQTETKKLPVSEAREVLISEAEEDLLDQDSLSSLATKRAEQTGIVFIDEIDKVCGAAAGKNPDVSREGVQRDLLPLVEGSTVGTKYGQVKTDHILFIASGAFHHSKPSDLMPEFQGRFPLRVELQSLTPEHFERILLEPQNALTKQYQELLATEGVKIEFKEDAIEEIAELTAEVNARTENIGARRLHTLLERVLEEVSYEAHDQAGETVVVDRSFVQTQLKDIVKDSDLSRFIL